MTNPLSRIGFNHPVQGAPGDATLYSNIEAIYQAIGDNIDTRWFTSPSLANGATVTLTHGFNLAFAELGFRFYTYTGTFTANTTAITRQLRGPSGVSVVANGTNPTKAVDVTNNTGGTISLATLIIQKNEKAVNQNLSVSSNITLVDKTLHLVSTAAARTLTLPPPAINAFLIVADITGGAEAFNITINPNAAETIDGAASLVIALNYAVAVLASDGTNWVVLNAKSKGPFYIDDATGWTGSVTTVTYSVAGLGIDARKVNWTFKDVSQNYLQIGADISHADATHVTVTVGIALAAGTYRLVGSY